MCEVDMPTEASTETELPMLHEDLVQLFSILKVLGLGAGFRREGKTPIQVLLAPSDMHAGHGVSAVPDLDAEVPVYHPYGQHCGSLGILSRGEILSDGFRTIIGALLSLTARSISERWFRLHHRKAWILAAAPSAQSGSSLLLALDRQFTLLGMDYQATEHLRPNDSAQPDWTNFFRPMSPLPTLRLRDDVPLKLMGAREDESWIGLLTPPDGDSRVTGASHTQLHSRPRCHALADLTPIEPTPLPDLPILTSGRRRRIEEFIETNLEMPLPVERLAKVAGMSPSHFARAFRNVLRMTPHRYVMWRRVLRARELIQNSDAGLAEIAAAAGFSDQSHLSRTFQLNMGESPREFRRRCR